MLKKTDLQSNDEKHVEAFVLLLARLVAERWGKQIQPLVNNSIWQVGHKKKKEST